MLMFRGRVEGFDKFERVEGFEKFEGFQKFEGSNV